MLLLMQLPTLHAFPCSRRSGLVRFWITRKHAVLASVAGGGDDGGRSAVTSSFRTWMVKSYEMARPGGVGMGATDLPYWEAQGQMAKSGMYCDPCTLRREYEHRHEQGDGAEGTARRRTGEGGLILGC